MANVMLAVHNSSMCMGPSTKGTPTLCYTGVLIELVCENSYFYSECNADYELHALTFIVRVAS